MTILNCDKVSMAYGTDIIIKDVSFALNAGDKLGIVGVNGAGKSTLLSIITGDITDHDGNVYIAKNKSIGFLAQNSVYNSDKSVYDSVVSIFSELILIEDRLELLQKHASEGNGNAMAEISELNESFISAGGLEYRNRCKGTLISLGFSEAELSMPVSNLSGGQKTRVALAAILLKDPDIIILDEPTNHLDIDSIAWLEKYLANSKKTIIVVSHDRYFLCKVTTKTLEIENHAGTMYNGNYDYYIQKKKTDREVLAHQYKNQQKEIARIEAYIAQQKRWNRERNIIAAESRQKQLDKMELINAPAPDPLSIRMSFTKSEESGNDVLSVRRISKSYNGRSLIDSLSFELKKRDRMLIIGGNGSGKSTLLKILNGALKPDCGVFDYGYNVTIGYYDQENQNLTDENDVLEEIWNDYPTTPLTEIRNALALFLFRGDDINKKVGNLSGGEKARITFSKLMLSKFNLLYLDEPTNHLDIMSREVLEDAILRYDGTIVAVSHDRYFISKLATRILSFDGGEITDFIGTYEEFLSFDERRKAGQQASEISHRASASRLDYEASKKELAEKRKFDRKIKYSKERIGEITEELSALALDEDRYSTDHVKLSGIYSKREELEAEMLDLMEFLEKSGEEY